MRDRGGSTAIEFAMLALPFLLFVFSIIEITMIFIADLALDNAVGDLGRQVRTGEIAKSEMTKAKFQEKVCDKVSVLLTCGKLKIDLRAYKTYGDVDPAAPADGNYSGFGFNAGGPDEIMALRVYYDWPLLTGFIQEAAGGKGTYLLAGVSAFKTEAY